MSEEEIKALDTHVCCTHKAFDEDCDCCQNDCVVAHSKCEECSTSLLKNGCNNYEAFCNQCCNCFEHSLDLPMALG